MLALIKQRDRGVRAKRLLEDEQFCEAVAEVRAEYVERLLDLKLSKVDEIMQVKRQLVALDDVIERLTGVVSAGKLADQQLNERK